MVVLSVCGVVWAGSFITAAIVGAATPTTRLACEQCEEADRFVRLQQVPDRSYVTSSRQFAHPFVLSPEDWATLLTRVEVQRQAEGFLFRDLPGPVLPAFTPEEIGYLSTALSKAFAQVQPREYVVFGLSQLNSYNMTEITTGGWFVEGASLHLVLPNYRKVVTMPGTRQLLWEHPLRPDAGPHYNLVPGHHQTSVRDFGVWSDLFSSSPSELEIAYQAVLVGGSTEVLTPQQSSIPPPETIAPHMSLEDRLRTLKRLHDQGLITEHDYRAKKQQLLEQF